MSIPSNITLFWGAFRAEVGEDYSDRFFEAFHFDDNQADANELADLVLAGVKRATASLVWSFERAGTMPPSPAPSASSHTGMEAPPASSKLWRSRSCHSSKSPPSSQQARAKAMGRWNTGAACTGHTLAVSALALAENQA